jgi:hypothetical protein
MTKSTWRTCTDALISASAVAIVVVAIVAADARVREQAQSMIRTAPSYTVASATQEARNVGSILWRSAMSRSLDHGPVVVFVAAAAVLVLCMVRS